MTLNGVVIAADADVVNNDGVVINVVTLVIAYDETVFGDDDVV